MKIRKISLVVCLCLGLMATVTAQTARSAAYDLHYDFTTKIVSGSAYKEKYFIVPYKSQQRIFIDSIPSNYSVQLNARKITVTPDNSTAKLLNGALKQVIFTSDVIETDEIEYQLEIKENDVTVETTTIFVKVVGGLKIDLSTGVVFHTLADESYHFDEAGTDEVSLSKDKQKGSFFPINPVILTHIHGRGKGFTTLGTTLGLGINDEGKVGYYLGGALLFGDRQRAILSAGLAFKPVDVLKGKYKNGQIFTADDIRPELEDVTESKFKTGFFFSFTYNLSSTVSGRD
jgi:hypothetical protein